MKREHWFFIKDIGESIQLISEFVGSMSFEEFMEDTKTKSAVAYQLHIIGEASKIFPGKQKRNTKRCPGASWQE